MFNFSQFQNSDDYCAVDGNPTSLLQFTRDCESEGEDYEGKK